MPSWPGSVWSPSNKSAGQTIDAGHVNDLQDEVVAIEGGYANGTARLNSSASTVTSLSVIGNSTLASSITIGGRPYVFPSSGGSTGDVLTIISTSGSTMGLEWRASAASSVASSGFTVSTGVLTLNQGQIAFPGTQVASANANTLDDYEEGTWTPVIGGAGGTSGQAYDFQDGTYRKIGSLVVARFYCVLNTEGTITGNVEIQGLPFSAAGTGAAGVSALRFNSLPTNWTHIIASGTGAAFQVSGNTAAAGGNLTALTATDIDNDSVLSGTLVYHV